MGKGKTFLSLDRYLALLQSLLHAEVQSCTCYSPVKLSYSLQYFRSSLTLIISVLLQALSQREHAHIKNIIMKFHIIISYHNLCFHKTEIRNNETENAVFRSALYVVKFC